MNGTETVSNGSVTAALAAFIADPSLRAPDDAAALARRAFADAVAVAIAGRSSSAGRLIVDYVASQEAGGRAGVIGSQLRTSAELAALANGTLAHALDFDDTNFILLGHPSCHLVPTALAVGEQRGASYRDCIDAFVVGLQTEVAIAAGVNPSHFEAGFHPTGTLATFGAAATAARLLSLSTEQTAFSLGIAASRAAGVRANVGTMTKPLHAGMAAMSGVQAAKLAALGWDASPTVIEAPMGFAAAFSGTDQPRIASILEQLGSEWTIATPASLVVKRFPACAATHPAIRAAIAVHEQMGEHAQAVADADVRVSEKVLKILRREQPQTGNAARFSLEYTVACGLLYGRVAPADFDNIAVHRPDLVELMQKITVLPPHHSTYDFGATVTARLHDGRSYTHVSPDTTADLAETLGDGATQEKFLECVGDSSYGRELWQTIRFGPDNLAAGAIVAATLQVAEPVAT